MNSYTISTQFNPNKVFLIRKNELEKRLDPEYYVPDLVAFEKRILAKKPKKLRDYVKSIASGSTPATTEQEKYYAEKENGIPFLRVQNLSSTGILEYDDCKYINEETHNGLLKRSQVSAGDLLVKITGVGRMAVASVAPEGFVGNINQHVCVIKTGDRNVSETLAAFLNTDIGEKLASRRSAGGTRPALDYPALLSIPIINDERIIEITKKVIAQKQKNEVEAEKLLASIDDYLLKELGIVLPEKVETQLIFFTRFKNLQGKRFDPFYHKVEFDVLEKSIFNSNFGKEAMRTILTFLESGSRPSGGVSQYESGILSLGGEHVNNKCEIEIRNEKFVPLEYHLKNLKTETQLNDIILVKDGATTGKIGIITENSHVGQNINEHVFMMRFAKSVNPHYILFLLATSFYQKIISRIITGATVTGLTKEVVNNLQIPLPPLPIQKEIADHITNIRQQAKALENEAKTAIEEAKRVVEAMILGE
jgi:restriction endonuclease S subunit